MKKCSCNKWLICCLVVSFAVNILVLALDTIPLLYSRIDRVHEESAKGVTEEVVVEQALKMAMSDEIETVWNEPRGFTREMLSLIRGSNVDENFKRYNYPRAYLFCGLSEYLIKKNNLNKLEIVEREFSKLIDNQGNPAFPLDKVDQVPFGITSLNLYKCYQKDKFLVFADSLYAYLKESVNKKYDAILYRKNSKDQLDDVIGMVVPFLVEYYKVTNKEEVLLLAEKQLDFYVTYGVDRITFIPAHGFDLESKVKTGSINWGRGIGWYLLGLVYLNDATNGKYNVEYEGIVASLNKLKNEDGVWTQFPGSSTIYDASTTTMFLFGLSYSIDFRKEDVLSSIKLGSDGKVKSTSGDTYGLNSYSSSFGNSELSQGMLLLLLSKLNK